MSSVTEPTCSGPAVDPDLPDEVDFTHAVRGKEGRQLVMEIMRYRQALRVIRDTPATEPDPVAAAHVMQRRAQEALDSRGRR